MAEFRPCYRHPRSVWIASCPDCTAWHQATRAPRRDTTGPADTAAPPHGTSGRSGADVLTAA